MYFPWDTWWESRYIETHYIREFICDTDTLSRNRHITTISTLSRISAHT
jgi:hypothetical protein